MSALYHELAHLWHPADLDRPAVRWNERLASFLGDRVTSALNADSGVDNAMNALSTGSLMFYVLFSVLGADGFDEIMGAYFRTFRSSGSTTEQFVDFVTERAPITSQIFAEWLYTVQWYEALHSGQSLSDVIAEYVQRR